MTPSNSHPRTAARGPRRALLGLAATGLLASLLATPAPALAQGRIQFGLGMSTFTQYQVGDDGSGLSTVPAPQVTTPRVFATSRADYPGGRMYLYSRTDGKRSISGYTYQNVLVWNEATGQAKAVTDIRGPLYVVNPYRWSNDGQDSFLSFNLASDPPPTATQSQGRGSFYRAWVSAAEIASPDFRPITLADLGTPRLEHVMDLPGEGDVQFYWWSHDGSRFYYLDPRNKATIRVRTVGLGVTYDDDPIAFVAPTELSELKVIPPVDPLNQVADRYLVASAMPIGTGILAMDLVTGSSWPLATQAKSSTLGLRGPCFSPDGSFIAFGNTRYDKKNTPYHGVYKVPFFGGPITRVAEVMETKVSGGGYVTVNTWTAQ